jgi:phenylalanyl-tRNA synthetase alpha chain
LKHLLSIKMNANSNLHPIELSLLRALEKGQLMSIEELVDNTGLEIDQIRRGLEWLKFKNMVQINDKIINIVLLGSNGKRAVIEGLPERRLVRAVQKDGMNTMSKIGKARLFDNMNEMTKAYEIAVYRNKWIQEHVREASISEPTSEKILIATKESERLSCEEKLLLKLNKKQITSIDELNAEEHKSLNLFKRRPNYILEQKQKITEYTISSKGKETITSLTNKDQIQSERRLTQQMITSGKWRRIRLSPLDVEAPVHLLYPGRKHPLINIIEEVKEAFVGLGFTEISGPIIQSSFWNFDALFTPQDHPARDMQDTFYISGLRQEDNLATDDHIEKISQIHKIGWNNKWDVEEAKRIVLRTHTTPVTIKYLAENRPENARVFCIGSVFRNEKTSYKHLAEFNQVEGIVTDENVSLRDLMGLQKEFYFKLGLKKIKFWPTFFPYTEPSLQSMVFIESLGKWVELFGMGIFRPEITQAIGIKNPVLAWGGGLERIAMLRFGLHDVRELYNNKLEWLRRTPRCPL